MPPMACSIKRRIGLKAVLAAFCSSLNCGVGGFLLLRGFLVGMASRSLRESDGLPREPQSPRTWRSANPSHAGGTSCLNLLES